MKRFIFLLSFLLFPLFICSLWAAGDHQTGAEALTKGANIWALDRWSDANQLLALRIEHMESEIEREWLEVDVEEGSVASTDAPVRAQEASTAVKVSVEGTIHRLEWNGRTIWETDEEILGRPVLSPDGKWIVLSFTPRGNETAALGELWRYELSSGQWTPLTENGAEESSPVISPDGTQVAFLREGDVWVIPSDRTTRDSFDEAALNVGEPLADFFATAQRGFDHLPPATIRVIHVAAKNACRPNVPDGRIDEIAFEEYIKRVVPHESQALWHSEALKAQAVASRTYAWRFVLANPDAEWHVTDTTSNQYMCNKTYASSNAAVEATRGQHLTYNGSLIAALFSAENSSPTAQNRWGHAYLSAVDDPISFGEKRKGHGQGYSQLGGKRWADLGWYYGQILAHYYTGAQLTAPAGNSSILLEASNRPTSPYLRGSALSIELNANDVASTLARDWWQDQNGTWHIGEWQEDSDGSNGWAHLFGINDLSDLQERRYRIEYQTTTRAAESRVPVLFLGIDRLSPLFHVESTLNEGQVELSFESRDNLSGVERIGWSKNEWQQEAEAVISNLPLITDASASAQRAVQLNPSQSAGALTLTFNNMQVEPNHYRFWFRLRTNEIATANQVATLRLFDEAKTPLQRGVRYIRAGDFPSNGWTWFFVDIDMTSNYAKCPTAENKENACRVITPVIEWHGTQQLEIDQIFLATRPSSLLNQATISLTPPEPFMLYANDHALNATILSCEYKLVTEPSLFSTTGVSSERLFLPIVLQNSALMSPTATPNASPTMIPTSTATASPTATSTPTRTATSTPLPASPTATGTSTATPVTSYTYVCSKIE